jgi:hypothetical protein
MRVDSEKVISEERFPSGDEEKQASCFSDFIKERQYLISFQFSVTEYRRRRLLSKITMDTPQIASMGEIDAS